MVFNFYLASKDCKEDLEYLQGDDYEDETFFYLGRETREGFMFRGRNCGCEDSFFSDEEDNKITTGIPRMLLTRRQWYDTIRKMCNEGWKVIDERGYEWDVDNFFEHIKGKKHHSVLFEDF